MRSAINQTEASILSEQNYCQFKRYLFKKWYRLQSEPQLLLEDIDAKVFVKNDIDINLMSVAVNLLKLDRQKLNLCLLFLNEILKLEKDIPKVAQEAIVNGNPFLFRSLFGDFKEAKNFAVGGKLNSSLETKYGNLFEKLMATFNNCRGIFDGGVDVVVEHNAFDIKSGPNVMNKSMVDAFSAKQRLIQEQQLLPELKSYKIALGYGKRENLNSFMAKIDSEILTAREAWAQITGIQHSPEIVFAIAGLIPKILGVRSVVSSMLTKSNLHGKDEIDELKFKELFNNSFAPINLTPQAKAELETIEYILN